MAASQKETDLFVTMTYNVQYIFFSKVLGFFYFIFTLVSGFPSLSLSLSVCLFSPLVLVIMTVLYAYRISCSTSRAEDPLDWETKQRKTIGRFVTMGLASETMATFFFWLPLCIFAF